MHLVSHTCYRKGMIKNRENLHDRLYTLLMWLFVTQGVSRSIIANVFHLNRGSINQMAVRNGWVKQRKQRENQALRLTPVQLHAEEPAGRTLAPLRIIHGVSIKAIAKKYGVSHKTLENYFRRKGVEEIKAEREQLIASFALLDAAHDGLLPAACASWVDEPTKAKHKAVRDERLLRAVTGND